jgi:hypothetical protein
MPTEGSALVGPEAKVERALEHLEALDLGCKTFLESEPYDVPVNYEPDLGCHVLRLSVREKPPLRLSAIVGDIVHNLRSSLDHAVWLLAGEKRSFAELHKERVLNKIYFPITYSPKSFRTHTVMGFINDDARTVLEKLQPYHRPKPKLHPLAVLNKLWNTDKHRVVHGGFAGLDFSGVSFRPAAVRIEALENVETTWMLSAEEEAKDGTEIARIRFGGGHAPPITKVDVKGKPTAEILFGSGDIAFRLETLRGIAEYATISLALIRPLLDR